MCNAKIHIANGESSLRAVLQNRDFKDRSVDSSWRFTMSRQLDSRLNHLGKQRSYTGLNRNKEKNLLMITFLPSINLQIDTHLIKAIR